MTYPWLQWFSSNWWKESAWRFQEPRTAFFNCIFPCTTKHTNIIQISSIWSCFEYLCSFWVILHVFVVALSIFAAILSHFVSLWGYLESLLAVWVALHVWLWILTSLWLFWVFLLLFRAIKHLWVFFFLFVIVLNVFLFVSDHLASLWLFWVSLLSLFEALWTTFL